MHGAGVVRSPAEKWRDKDAQKDVPTLAAITSARSRDEKRHAASRLSAPLTHDPLSQALHTMTSQPEVPLERQVMKVFVGLPKEECV